MSDISVHPRLFEAEKEAMSLNSNFNMWSFLKPQLPVHNRFDNMHNWHVKWKPFNVPDIGPVQKVAEAVEVFACATFSHTLRSSCGYYQLHSTFVSE